MKMLELMKLQQIQINRFKEKQMENITISKELLENVLNWDLDRKKFYSDHNIKDNLISVYFFQPDSIGKTGTHYWQTTNIYEFAYKCKEWAKDKEFFIKSFWDYNNTSFAYISAPFWEDIMDIINTGFSSDSEFEAIINACELILEQTN